MNESTEFVAINFIDCKPDYITRFEELFGSRAQTIDHMDGFKNMRVLKSKDGS